MNIRINGQNHEVSPGLDLKSILEGLKFEPEHVVVELNYSIIARERLAETRVNDNDSLEIVRFVGGG